MAQPITPANGKLWTRLPPAGNGTNKHNIYKCSTTRIAEPRPRIPSVSMHFQMCGNLNSRYSNPGTAGNIIAVGIIRFALLDLLQPAPCCDIPRDGHNHYQKEWADDSASGTIRSTPGDR